MNIKEIEQKILFYENRVFGIKVMVNSSYPMSNYNELVQQRNEFKQEISKLNKILSIKKQRKEKLEKITDNVNR